MLCLIFPSGSFSFAFFFCTVTQLQKKGADGAATDPSYQRNTLLGGRQEIGVSDSSSVVLSLVWEEYAIRSEIILYQLEYSHRDLFAFRNVVVLNFEDFLHLQTLFLPLQQVECVCNTSGWIFVPADILHVLLCLGNAMFGDLNIGIAFLSFIGV